METKTLPTATHNLEYIHYTKCNNAYHESCTHPHLNSAEASRSLINSIMIQIQTKRVMADSTNVLPDCRNNHSAMSTCWRSCHIKGHMVCSTVATGTSTALRCCAVLHCNRQDTTRRFGGRSILRVWAVNQSLDARVEANCLDSKRSGENDCHQKASQDVRDVVHLQYQPQQEQQQETLNEVWFFCIAARPLSNPLS